MNLFLLILLMLIATKDNDSDDPGSCECDCFVYRGLLRTKTPLRFLLPPRLEHFLHPRITLRHALFNVEDVTFRLHEFLVPAFSG